MYLGKCIVMILDYNLALIGCQNISPVAVLYALIAECCTLIVVLPLFLNIRCFRFETEGVIYGCAFF
jgi:hypothetical protein